MKSLKIAVDARPLSQPMVGITRYSYELLLRLLDSHHQWYLYLDQKPAHALPHRPNVHIRYTNAKSSFVSTIYSQLVFPLWASKDKIDVFWSPRHHLPLLLPVRIKALLTIYDLVWKLHPETMKPLGLWLERLLMPGSLRRADQVMSISQSTLDDITSHYPHCASKLTVVHPGLGHAAVASKLIIPSPSYFLFVGTLEPRKNLPRLLRAFAVFAKTNNDTNLIIVGGEGWGKGALATLIDTLGLQERIILTSRVSEEDLANYYGGATALVMPSLYEGFGLPLLEAMGYGVPVISSNFGAMKEVTGDAGILVSPYCQADITSAMEAMLEYDLRATLSVKATQRASSFNWDDSANKVRGLIEELA
jgi:glycosyltransferase involved in cell wall biosynthesis